MNRFRTSDGLSLAYQDYGKGQPVLCLAGLTRNSRDFECIAEDLKDVRLIMMDYRGRGESDWDPNTLNYTPHIEARDAFELLDQLGIDKVKVIGTSRGGIVAMVMALSSRNRIGGILFNDIGPEIESIGLEYILQNLGTNPDCRDLDETSRWLAEISADFKYVPISRWRAEAYNRYRQVGNQVVISYDPGLRDAFKSAFEGSNIDLWPHFSNLNGLPLFLIRGENSNLLSEATSIKMKKVCPDLEITVASNRGHCPFLDEPESKEAIQKFLFGV